MVDLFHHRTHIMQHLTCLNQEGKQENFTNFQIIFLEYLSVGDIELHAPHPLDVDRRHIGKWTKFQYFAVERVRDSSRHFIYQFKRIGHGHIGHKAIQKPRTLLL